MCLVKPPKLPDNKIAPPPPVPDESAANKQGAPVNPNKSDGQGSKRNKLRIDLKAERNSLGLKPGTRDTSTNTRFISAYRG